MKRKEWSIQTSGRGFTDLTARASAFVRESGVREGMSNFFLAHTSASLILGENADPSVRRDLEAFFTRLIPDGDPSYEHSAEGPDDMPSHIRAALTQTSLGIPLHKGKLALGTWQGLYVFEHRDAPHRREVMLHVIGD